MKKRQRTRYDVAEHLRNLEACLEVAETLGRAVHHRARTPRPTVMAGKWERRSGLA